MKMRIVACLFVVTLLTGSLPASAQQPSAGRPYQGLFAGGVDNAEQVLAATGTLGGGYSNNVFADPLVVGVGQTPTLVAGPSASEYGSATAGLSYTFDRSRLSVGASASSDTRYFPNLDDRWITGYSGHAGVTVRILSNLSVTQNVSYQPWYAFSPFPQVTEARLGHAPIGGAALAASRDGYLHSSSAVGFTQALGRRSSLALSYAYVVSNFDGPSDDLRTQSGSGVYRYAFMRDLGVRVGYSYSEGRYGAADDDTRRINSQIIDAGLDFNRALSLTRRTTLSFATGTAAMNDQIRTHYRFTGHATLNHQIGRTWGANFGYERNLSFVEAFHEPLFYDAVSAGVSGLITRRLEFRASAGASFGELGLAQSNDYDSVYAGSSLTQALSRYLALGVDYNVQWYRFGSGQELPLGLSQNMSWQSVRGYVSVWAPLVQSRRRSNATR